MRKINRLSIPKILEDNGAKWTERFITSGKKRPPSSQYGHHDIRNDLMTFSSHKCYYCERLLKDIPDEVNHYLEAADFKHLSFIWENLYLACSNCNKKISHLRLAVTEALDPCFHDDDTIKKHLDFDDEIITSKTDFGKNTIQRFRLSNATLDYVRGRELKKFHKLLIQLQSQCILENRQQLNNDELELLKKFANHDKPFSLMFYYLLKKNKIL